MTDRPVDFAARFQAIRDSGMNDWVGGADPELVGDACTNIFLRHVPVDVSSRVLDFGCGVGRVALSLLRQRPQIAGLTGLDIVPKLVGFCRENVGAHFPQTRFELMADSNVHYDHFKDAATPLSRAQADAAFGGAHDAAYAFSVFTHIDTHDFSPLLKFVGSMLKPGGHFLFTCFILTPFSRATIDLGWTLPSRFPEPVFEEGGAVFIGNKSDRLAFIAFDIQRIEQMVWEAGLIPCAIEYGNWRGAGLSHGYQDAVLCRRPSASAF